MKISRRVVLGGILSAGIATGAYVSFGWAKSEASGDKQPLKIPDINDGNFLNGVRNFDLSLQKGMSQFIEGVHTPTYGINGSYLGPTLKFKASEVVKLNVTNNIGRKSTLHWHGMHLPAKADGGPHQPIEQGSTWQSEFTVKQKAGTFWYHSHLMGETGHQVYHGLAGLIIVEDEPTNELGLPQEYGVDDVPLILQDRQFNNDGSFAYLGSMHDRMIGMTGDQMLVNGTLNPYFEASTSTLRLRLLNGSNARIYNLSFDDEREFYQIGSDGGLLEKPVMISKLTLAPAERVELIVDISDGTPAILTSSSITTGMMGMFGGSNEDFDILEIRPNKTVKTDMVMPKKLASMEPIDISTSVKTRQFTLSVGMGGMMGGGNMSINGKTMNLNRIDEVVKLNTSEIWEIINPTDQAHPFHIHDVQFRIIDRDGQPPIETEKGLKDTILVPAGQAARLFLSFKDYTDPEHPYMYHCHILEHEDAGMMGQFTVVA